MSLNSSPLPSLPDLAAEESSLSDPEMDDTFSSRQRRLHHQPSLFRSISEFGFHHRAGTEMAARRVLHDRMLSMPSPRQRTISLNQNVVNTEREPIILDEKSNKTIFVQGNVY